MPDEDTPMKQCYNRGCAQIFDPKLNKEGNL
jgi:hypothetical protein